MLVADIRKAVADHYGMTVAELLTVSHCRRFARPRQVGMYLARQLTDKTEPQIARVFQRDRKTVHFGIKQVEKFREQIAPDIFAILGRLPA